MARTLTEQMRVPRTSDSPARWSGDGAPMHSAIPFDLVRWLNNAQSYREPTYQFMHDASQNAGVAGTNSPPRTQYRVAAAGGGDGQVMLMQAPILVPVDAVRLCWSLGIYRSHVPAEGTLDINVTNIIMYLASGPCTYLADVTTPSPNREDGRLFLPSFITGPYSSNTVAATGASANTPNPCFTEIQSETWTDFAPRGLNNINDRNTNPWAILIVTAQITSGVTDEIVRAAELSIWGQYE